MDRSDSWFGQAILEAGKSSSAREFCKIPAQGAASRWYRLWRDYFQLLIVEIAPRTPTIQK